jgi:hypothetical protein
MEHVLKMALVRGNTHPLADQMVLFTFMCTLLRLAYDKHHLHGWPPGMQKPLTIGTTAYDTGQQKKSQCPAQRSLCSVGCCSQAAAAGLS